MAKQKAENRNFRDRWEADYMFHHLTNPFVLCAEPTCICRLWIPEMQIRTTQQSIYGWRDKCSSQPPNWADWAPVSWHAQVNVWLCRCCTAPQFLPDTLPQLRAHAAQMLSMFGSTYLCEQLFSLMKINKATHRSRLTDKHHSVLRISSAQSLTPDFDELRRDGKYLLQIHQHQSKLQNS